VQRRAVRCGGGAATPCARVHCQPFVLRSRYQQGRQFCLAPVVVRPCAVYCICHLWRLQPIRGSSGAVRVQNAVCCASSEPELTFIYLRACSVGGCAVGHGCLPYQNAVDKRHGGIRGQPQSGCFQQGATRIQNCSTSCSAAAVPSRVCVCRSELQHIPAECVDLSVILACCDSNMGSLDPNRC
jgi:hypothetical protein